MITYTRKQILKILEEHPLLIIFLKKKKVYLKYIKYAMNPDWFSDHINRVNNPEKIIEFSFRWLTTPEGYDFWCDLNIQYKTFYNEY